ncbi:MAG: tetratricopeptide repeat protein [Candidatus Obscuribacterales bacterium]|nr:tetratricopeptide repeat protein [Candidatus Obscuribacterales bacterium]
MTKRLESMLLLAIAAVVSLQAPLLAAEHSSNLASNESFNDTSASGVQTPDFLGQLNPSTSEGFCSRGSVRSRVGDLSGAARDFDSAVELDAKNAKAYTARGYLRIYSSDSKNAFNDFEKAIELDPNQADAYCGRGQVFSDMGDEERALADFNEAVKIAPSNAQAYIYRGFHLGRHGKKDRAIADFDRTIKLDPNNALAFCYRGSALEAVQSKDKAIADFEQVIKFDPQYAWAYYRRGQLRSELGDRQQAVGDFEKYIALQPKDPWGYRARGFVHYELADSKKAIDDYSKAIKLDSSDPWTFSARGYARAKLGDTAGAVKDYKKVAQLEKKKEAAPKKVENWTPPIVELIEDRAVYEFARTTLLKAQERFGKPVIPVNTLLIFHRPGPNCQTIMMDEEKGIFCIFIANQRDDDHFFGNLGHEVLHLLNAKLFDPYIEGLCSVFGEQAIDDTNPIGARHRAAFRTLVARTPFYAETYQMIKDIEQRENRDNVSTLFNYATKEPTVEWLHVDVDRWLNSVSVEDRKTIAPIIDKFAVSIDKTMPRNGAYFFSKPTTSTSQD